ncbi:phosphoenolpyruvate--protein phosphotransferase [Desulfobulbus sp.]|uniref:phosphoenolpyruvate--protein phosphotransferase n=1 Tax=Desulfobulbus sp. TaxID=895 RepID=UPI0027BA65E2|nr:phosphoenolpyruvate--protein phosphotransferase [Desulfobulbus sp.]
MNNNRLELLAPLSGVMVPLETIPDPVFAQKIVGDGVSIDPVSSELSAPVAGTVVNLHRACHALTLRSEEGIEVLLHIGIDTVELKGEGFTALVKEGDAVKAGQPLIRFDLDGVARKARSLLTQMLIANGERVARYLPAVGMVRAGETAALTLEFAAPTEADHAAQAAQAGQAGQGEAIVGEIVPLPNPSGLHARPAAVLATAAKKFKSVVFLQRNDQEVNAKSVVGLMGLSTAQGDPLRVKALGPDAQEAVGVLTELLRQGCGEKPGEAPAAAPSAPEPVRVKGASADEMVGVSASPGLAVGKIVQYRQQALDVAEQGAGPDQERAAFESALRTARNQIETLKQQINADAGNRNRVEILTAHQELLDDPGLIDLAIAGVSQGKSAGFAWRAAFTQYAAQLENLDNALLRERANDVRDVGRRVLALLTGVVQAALTVAPGTILAAEELAPSDTAALDPAKVIGFCTTTGGATSHVAILARSLGIPAVCGIEESALLIADGTLVVLDGSQGILRAHPSESQVAEARDKMTQIAAKREADKLLAIKPAVTLDGHLVKVMANIRNLEDAREALQLGGDGVGLLRSEFLFHERSVAPTYEEQAAEYAAVAQALGPERELVIRTLDVGGDKPLTYLPLPKEDNPFLGMRGIRVSLERPDLLRIQLRAMLAAAEATQLHIMFPMIATIDELRAAKMILAEESAATGKQAKVGVMIEVPSAAIMAEVFAREADFFSVGTNDLTQYTLAMDRGHPKLAKRADGLDPSVLRMIALAVEGAHKHGKWVGVCGGLASDVMAVPVLIGLGVDELSVSVPAIPSVKALVQRLSLDECRNLAREALALASSGEVRTLLAGFAQ